MFAASQLKSKRAQITSVTSDRLSLPLQITTTSLFLSARSITPGINAEPELVSGYLLRCNRFTEKTWTDFKLR